MRPIEIVEEKLKRTDLPEFGPGDLVRISFKVVEGGKERAQSFEGVVIRRAHGGLRETVTLRKTSYGVGVERIFPLHSPMIDKIEVIRRGAVRRARLYYLRERRGKSARIKEKLVRK